MQGRGQGPLQVELNRFTTVIPDQIAHSHDQLGHQGVDKKYNKIQKRLEWPGLKKACEKWISACLSCQQAINVWIARHGCRITFQSGMAKRSWVISRRS